MDKDFLVLWIILFLLVFVGVFFLVDYGFSGEELCGSAVVVEKTYAPGSTAVGVANGVSSGGGSAVGVVVASSSDSYSLMVDVVGGYRDILTCGKRTYLKVVAGDTVDVYSESGLITGINYGYFAEARGE